MFTDELLSIDIGNKFIKAVLGVRVFGGIKVLRQEIIPTPRGCFSNSFISNTAEVAIAIRSTGIVSSKVKEVIFTSKSNDIVIKELILPKVKEEEMITAIKFNLQDYLSIRLEDYFIQFKHMEDVNEVNVRKQRVKVALYPKVMAENYYSLVKELNLKPGVLDLSSNSISKLFTKKVKINGEVLDTLKETFVVVDLGHETTQVVIMHNGICDFERIIPFGGSSIDLAVRRELGCTENEAEGLRNSINAESQGERYLILNECIERHINDLCLELDRISQFYKNKRSDAHISKGYICGGGSYLFGIRESMEKNLNIKVELLENPSNVLCNFENKEMFMNCYGVLMKV